MTVSGWTIVTKANVVLIPERSTSNCRDDTSKLFWTLSLDGGTLSGTSTEGAKFSAPVAPDGSVKATYQGSFGGSNFPVELTGNAKSKQLETFNTRANCRFKLVTVQ